MDQTELKHYGIKGMKWGVRKTYQPSSEPGFGRDTPHTISKDGAITIPKGAVVQRMVTGKTLFNSGPGQTISEGMTYAAFKGRDKLEYENNFGFRKNLVVKESSKVALLRAKVALKSPSPARTSELYFDELKKNPSALKKLKEYSADADVSPRSVDRALANPRTVEAYRVYATAFDGGSYSKDLKGINERFVERLTKEGFNMVVDPTDSDFAGIYDTPIAILNGKKNLELSSQRVVDKASSITVKQAVKQAGTTDQGKQYMERYVKSTLSHMLKLT